MRSEHELPIYFQPLEIPETLVASLIRNTLLQTWVWSTQQHGWSAGGTQHGGPSAGAGKACTGAVVRPERQPPCVMPYLPKGRFLRKGSLWALSISDTVIAHVPPLPEALPRLSAAWEYNPNLPPWSTRPCKDCLSPPWFPLGDCSSPAHRPFLTSQVSCFKAFAFKISCLTSFSL